MSKEKRNKFSEEQKEDIVISILKGTESYRSIARRLSTSHRLISLWVACYKLHGKRGLSFKQALPYSGDFKLRLLQEILKEGISLQQVSAKYLISPSVISNWKQEYMQGGVSALFIEKRRGRPSKMKKKSKKRETNPLSESDKLLKENEYLRAENEYLKKLQALIQKQKAQKNN